MTMKVCTYIDVNLQMGFLHCHVFGNFSSIVYLLCEERAPTIGGYSCRICNVTTFKAQRNKIGDKITKKVYFCNGNNTQCLATTSKEDHNLPEM